jgi:hypothetical protein
VAFRFVTIGRIRTAFLAAPLVTASTLLAAAALVAAVGFLVLVWRKGFRELRFKLGSIEGTLVGIDREVNDQHSIPERLDTIEREQRDMMRRLNQLAANQQRHHPDG